MEFDKSKILTVVTADQAKVGSIGYFSNYIPTLKGYVAGVYSKPDKLIRVSLDTIYPFFDGNNYYSLFYPAPEPTYSERQAQWVKENNVKAGTKVRVTRTFTEDEDGSSCCEHDDLVGMTGVVGKDCIAPHNLGVDMSNGRFIAIPYFALEVIKELTYAERQAQWVKENNVKVGTKVRIIRSFVTYEDGCTVWWASDMNNTIGKEGTITNIDHNGVGFRVGFRVSITGAYCGYWYPYFVLEVIKEPTYRPFKNAEEFKPYRYEWFRVKHDGGMLRICAYNDEGVQEANGKFNTYQIFFEKAERENGEPCGVKVE